MATVLYMLRGEGGRTALTLCAAAWLVDLVDVTHWPTTTLVALTFSAGYIALGELTRLSSSAGGRLLELALVLTAWRSLRLAWLWLGVIMQRTPAPSWPTWRELVLQLAVVVAAWMLAELILLLQARRNSRLHPRTYVTSA